MRNRLTIGVLSVCTLLLAGPQAVSAQGHMAELGVRYWKPSPELVLASGSLTRVGLGDVDFVQDFGIEDTSFPEYRAVIGRKHKLRVSKVSFNYTADATVRRTLVFQGRTFTVGAPASTDVGWDIWTFGYEWDVVSRRGGFLGMRRVRRPQGAAQQQARQGPAKRAPRIRLRRSASAAPLGGSGNAASGGGHFTH